LSPAELAQRIAALDWSGLPLQHQLAVSAAVETLKGIPMTTTEAAIGVAIRQNGEVIDAREMFNVVPLPVRPRTCWTTLHQLDGRPWATSSHFGPGGAWEWIVETVAHEHGVSEDQVGCAESDETQPYDCDDLVTVDGLPVYRVQHLVK
jgi:hypothetical protein